MNQMKNLAVSSATISTTTNVTLTSAIQSSAQPVSTASYINEYEITDTIAKSIKKPTGTIAAFPPRPMSATDVVNQKPVTSDNQFFISKPSMISKDEKMNHYEHDIPTPTPSHEGGIRFGTTPGPQTASIASPMYVNNGFEKLSLFRLKLVFFFALKCRRIYFAYGSKITTK